MFRDGQYLEVIKASDRCSATAVVTVQEKIIEIKKKKVATNKWLDLEDWAALYKILERAILRNVERSRHSSRRRSDNCEWKKSTRQLEVTYTFEPSSECLRDVAASLPTIRVNVSPARTPRKPRSETRGKSKKFAKNDVESAEKTITTNHACFDEYVPDAPTAKKPRVEYVPSRKSSLENKMSPNEYTPTTTSIDKSAAQVVRYVPNSLGTTATTYETYEPKGTNALFHLSDAYVPTSKGVKASFEEYQPDFTSKSMKFDDSYVPSSVRLTNDNSKKHSRKHSSGRRGTLTK